MARVSTWPSKVPRNLVIQVNLTKVNQILRQHVFNNPGAAICGLQGEGMITVLRRILSANIDRPVE